MLQAIPGNRSVSRETKDCHIIRCLLRFSQAPTPSLTELHTATCLFGSAEVGQRTCRMASTRVDVLPEQRVQERSKRPGGMRMKVKYLCYSSHRHPRPGPLFPRPSRMAARYHDLQSTQQLIWHIIRAEPFQLAEQSPNHGRIMDPFLDSPNKRSVPRLQRDDRNRIGLVRRGGCQLKIGTRKRPSGRPI